MYAVARVGVGVVIVVGGGGGGGGGVAAAAAAAVCKPYNHKLSMSASVFSIPNQASCKNHELQRAQPTEHGEKNRYCTSEVRPCFGACFLQGSRSCALQKGPGKGNPSNKQFSSQGSRGPVNGRHVGRKTLTQAYCRYYIPTPAGLLLNIFCSPVFYYNSTKK